MSQVLSEGQEVDVVILQSDNEHHNIRVGMKQLESDPWSLLKEQYPEGSSINGTITNITEFGMFVKVVGDIEGLVPKSQIADSRYVDLDAEIKKYNVGDAIKASVLEIQTGKQKLTLSLRELQRQLERNDIAKYMQDEEASEGGATLGDFLKKEE
jgi:small subunit ribosomal protein S1